MPLQIVAMGLVLLLVTAPVGSGWDLVPDPLGWVLVLLGTGQLADLERRGLLLGLGAVAAVVSAALWVPGLREQVLGAEEALIWTANLPQAAFTALLAWSLSARARSAGVHAAANWLRTSSVLLVVAGVSPALVGAGLDQLAEASYVVAGVALLLLVFLLFWYGRAPWAQREPAAAPPT